MRQTVLIAVVATLLITSASQPAKAFSPIGIAIGAGMVGALQDDLYRRQKSQQSEQYQRSQSATESNSTKKKAKARDQKPKRDDLKIAKDKRELKNRKRFAAAQGEVARACR